MKNRKAADKQSLSPGKRGALAECNRTADDGAQRCRVVLSDTTGSMQTQGTLDFLARSSANPASGDFFRVLARHLSETLDMGFVCIDRLDGDNLTAHTVAVFSNGNFEDNVSYALKDTPCGEVVGKHVCCFPSAIKTLFPNDVVLQQMEAESYIGVTLWSHDGRPIGLIAVIGSRPMTNREQAESLLKLVAERTAAELERTQAEEALRETSMRLQESVRAANVGLWDWDLATHRVRYSPEWKRQIGYDDAEIGDEFYEWESRVHPEDLAPTLNKVRDAITGERQRYQAEFRFRHKDGSYRWIVAQCSLLRDREGKVARIVGSHIDLTDRKKTEAEREEALLRAEAASHAKSEFLAVMSHELRSPLNGVLGFAGLLSDTGLTDEQRGYVQTISSSGWHLLSLVNDILDYTSMEHGAMKILEAPFALAGLVDISRKTVSTIAAEKGIGLHSEIAPGVPEQILGDERRIRQILINLLSNAVKFTSRGSVVLRIAPAMEGTMRFLDFSIKDSGIGIAPEMLARLFQPFTQGDSQLNRAYGGTGLGLAISKHLAEAMGGSISVTSTPGMGSMFTFRLPLKLSPGTSPPEII